MAVNRTSSRMENGLSMATLSAKQIVLAKGRGYIYKRKYPQVVVFTRAVLDVDRLERAFGGHHYKHGTGIIWVLSSRAGLRSMLRKIAPEQSIHSFESTIEPYLGGNHDEKVS